MVSDDEDNTMNILKVHMGEGRAVRHGITQACVVQTDDQCRRLRAFVQWAEQYGKPAKKPGHFRE